MNLAERDSKLLWHPFTQKLKDEYPIAIHKAQGCYLYAENGQTYLDLISSWWVNLHGHAHPEIAAAIHQQALQLEHVLFAGFTHAPAVTLCEELSNLLPQELTRFFFSDNGSTAVETALKMAYQYWWNKDEAQRTLFLCFEGGYHGDTFGAMSVGAYCNFHSPFNAFFFEVLGIPFSNTWDQDDDLSQKENAALAVLDEHLKNKADKIAAIILEPLVQGASGMRFCRPAFINQVIDKVRAQGILVIFDEVMTGFGRTGSYFAFEQTQCIPDFLCLAKGLSGGFLPLALTVTREFIYEAFLGENLNYTFAHGHSYTANPLACAAAKASLKILTSPSTMTALQAIKAAHQQGLSYLNDRCSNIQHSRVLGTIAAFEIDGHYSQSINAYLKQESLAKGLLLRPLGSTLYLLPPYCISAEELRQAYAKIAEILMALNQKRKTEKKSSEQDPVYILP